MTIHHLETGLCAGAGSHQNLKTIRDTTGTEPANILRIDGVRQTELFAYSHLRGSTSRQRLRHDVIDYERKNNN